MDILRMLSKIKITISLDNMLVFLFIIFLISLIAYIVYKVFKDKIKIRTLSIGSFSVDLECNKDVKSLANEVYIELSTRKISLPFDETNDLITEVYDSWYSAFERLRQILKNITIKKHNKNTEKLTNLIIKILNEELRPHLTKWQVRFRNWYNNNKNTIEDPQIIQKKYPKYDELVEDLKRVNRDMIELTNELDKIRKGE